eukprot:jgi/Phyca11/133009/e_gw1.292.7.1
MYADGQLKNPKVWSKNYEELQSKKMKSQEFMPLPHREDRVLIASPPGAHGWRECSRTRPLLSGGDADTGRVRAATSWGPKLNAWLVDLRADGKSDCGSPKQTTSVSGMTGVC